MHNWIHILILFSLLWISGVPESAAYEFDYDRPVVSSHLNSNLYLRHRLRRGDAPAYIMKRLDLLPITSQGGSLHHFYRLNPDLLSHEKIPGGTEIVLPITQLPKNSPDNKHFWKNKNGYVLFARNPRWKKRPKIKSTAENYNFGHAKMKLKLWREAPIVKKFIGTGLASRADIAGPVIVEIPLREARGQYQQRSVASVTSEDLEPMETSLERAPASTSLQTKAKVPQDFSLRAGTQLLTRQYEISTNDNSTGSISSTTLLGLTVGASYQRSWLNLDLDVSLENEEVESSPQVNIEKESSTRTDLSLKQKFSWGRWMMGFGFGLVDSTVFYSQSTTLLRMGYLSNPYAVFNFKREISLLSRLKTYGLFEGRYLFGGSTGTLQLNSGYEGRLGMAAEYDHSQSLKFMGLGQLLYQESNPVFYNQQVLGLQMSLGLSWQF